MKSLACIVCFLTLSLGNVLAADAKGELMPREKTNLSIRNEVEIAMTKGRSWLKKQQTPEGYWSSPEYPAVTGLVLMALKEPKEAQIPEQVTKGYSYLLSCVQPDGGIYKKGLANYNTAISLTALAAANDPKFREVMTNARRFVVGQQATKMADPALDGGMGYGPGGTNRQHPDMSNTVFALEALRATQQLHTGKENPPDIDWQAAIGFLERCQNLKSHNKEPWASDDPDNKGGFVYFPGHSMAGEVDLPNGKKALRSYGSISYAGLLSYVYADLKKDDDRVVAVLKWLGNHYTLDENPGMGNDGLFYYYQMMAKALSIYGEDKLQTADAKSIDWRKELALKLINLQNGDGYWANESGRWMEKDPVLVTTYALLALQYIYSGM